jgi:methylated-DNA-[protein]-cysteine S-methyltransferase
MNKNDLLTSALDALYLHGPATAATEQAQVRLRAALAEHGATRAEVWYDVLARSPIGEVFVGVTAQGLCAVRFGLSERQFVADLARETRAVPVRSAARAGAATRQVAEYLSGRRTSFDVPVDLGSATVFQRQVLLAACQIPRGQVRTYSDLARQIGRPKAARAVGQALGSNPVPIVVPCHRVLAADGSLRGYSGGGGIATKEQLLKLEGAWG